MITLWPDGLPTSKFLRHLATHGKSSKKNDQSTSKWQCFSLKLLTLVAVQVRKHTGVSSSLFGLSTITFVTEISWLNQRQKFYDVVNLIKGTRAPLHRSLAWRIGSKEIPHL